MNHYAQIDKDGNVTGTNSSSGRHVDKPYMIEITADQLPNIFEKKYVNGRWEDKEPEPVPGREVVSKLEVWNRLTDERQEDLLELAQTDKEIRNIIRKMDLSDVIRLSDKIYIDSVRRLQEKNAITSEEFEKLTAIL